MEIYFTLDSKVEEFNVETEMSVTDQESQSGVSDSPKSLSKRKFKK